MTNTKINPLQMPEIKKIMGITTDMYRLGWHERNAGNISVMLDEKEVAKYIDINKTIRQIPLINKTTCGKPSTTTHAKMAGKIFLVTGTGSYFKNIKEEPENNLGIVRVSNDGKSTDLLWGYASGGTFTSEFSAHLFCHASRLKVNPNNRVIMHAHPNNLVAMSYIHSINDKEYTRTLWQMCIEAILIFPEGVGTLPWMLCGTEEIAIATAKKMEEFKIVLWAMHGVFGCGATLDEAFGLIETAEKGADIYIKTLNNPIKLVTTDEQIKALANFWNAPYRKEWLN